MSQWVITAQRLPPENVVVETQDSAGSVQNLKRVGNLWWTPDGGMYVYYVPTQWRYKEA